MSEEKMECRAWAWLGGAELGRAGPVEDGRGLAGQGCAKLKNTAAKSGLWPAADRGRGAGAAGLGSRAPADR